jgi:hypothetical protein
MASDLLLISKGLTYDPDEKVIYCNPRELCEQAGIPVTQETMLAAFQMTERCAESWSRELGNAVDGVVLVGDDALSMQDFINQQEIQSNGNTIEDQQDPKGKDTLAS